MNLKSPPCLLLVAPDFKVPMSSFFPACEKLYCSAVNARLPRRAVACIVLGDPPLVYEVV